LGHFLCLSDGFYVLTNISHTDHLAVILLGKPLYDKQRCFYIYIYEQ